MVTIRQHGEDNRLHDIASFLPDIDAFFSVDSWQFCVEECLGVEAIALENATDGFPEVADSKFRAMYSGIYQTIDGRFIALSNGTPVVELVAIDSSFWEVSGTPEFESHMLGKYGVYQAFGT